LIVIHSPCRGDWFNRAAAVVAPGAMVGSSVTAMLVAALAGVTVAGAAIVS
jgi:hypothetical protein